MIPEDLELDLLGVLKDLELDLLGLVALELDLFGEEYDLELDLVDLLGEEYDLVLLGLVAEDLVPLTLVGLVLLTLSVAEALLVAGLVLTDDLDFFTLLGLVEELLLLVPTVVLFLLEGLFVTAVFRDPPVLEPVYVPLFLVEVFLTLLFE